MSQIKEYYSKIDLTSYKNDNYYHNMTEVMNQIKRIKIVKKFFSRSLKPNSKILDMGCGHGSDIIHLSQEFGSLAMRFVGIDISRKTIMKLKEMRVKNCEFFVGDAENLDLKEKFDIVLSLEVVEHLENFDGYLESIRKHLNPGGVLILSTPNDSYFLKGFYNLLVKIKRKELKSVDKVKSQYGEIETHVNLMKFSQLKKKLEKFGFEIVDKERTMIMFGAGYMEPFYGILAFLDQLFPKKITYLGCGYVVLARLKSRVSSV